MAKNDAQVLEKGGIKSGSKPNKAPKKKQMHCPYCAQKLNKVELYDEYFCDTCNQYIHRHLLGIKQKERVAILCPGCKSEPEYIHDYARHYCHQCKRYLSIGEIETKKVPVVAEKTPAPPPTDFYMTPPPIQQTKGYLCKKCNNELQFIYQYQRWYCYSCGEYI